MLEKPLFSPAQPRRAETRFSPGGVLTVRASSTGTRPPHRLGGAHRRGAPYSSHRAPQRVRLRYFHRLRPCPRNGASLGEEVVLATSGRGGEVTAGVGRVRRSAFLSILFEAHPFG